MAMHLIDAYTFEPRLLYAHFAVLFSLFNFGGLTRQAFSIAKLPDPPRL